MLGLLIVAAGNLAFIQNISTLSLVASVLWLLLVSWLVADNIRDEGGCRRYLINRLGAYSAQHFVRATPEQDAQTISVGYVMWGRFLPCLTIDTKSISSIDWSAGQATAMAGRDMNDWHVALWYHHPDGPQRRPFPGVREEEVFLIGPSGPRTTVETFGRELVDFLKGVGVELTPGKDHREFNTSSRRAAVEGTDQRRPH